MSKAAQLRSKFSAKQRKYGPMTKTLYKRVTTSVGGDPLIHRAGTTTKIDTALDPQPLYTVLSETLVLTASKQAQPGDYEIPISADAISLTELQSLTLMLVLKDSAGNEEPLKILHTTVAELQGEYISFTVYARSMLQ